MILTVSGWGVGAGGGIVVAGGVTVRVVVCVALACVALIVTSVFGVTAEVVTGNAPTVSPAGR